MLLDNKYTGVFPPDYLSRYTPSEDQIMPRDSTLSEKVTDFISRQLGGDYRNAKVLNSVLEIAFPGYGTAATSDEAKREFLAGNYKNAAVLGGASVLGIIPLVGSTASKVVRQSDGAKGLLVNVYPKPPKKFKDPAKGKGQYIDTGTGSFISESSRTRGQISINPETGRGQLRVSREEIPADRLVPVSSRPSKDYPEGQMVVQASEKGTNVKSNLLASDKWSWVGKPPKGGDNYTNIITAVGKPAGGKSGHYYAANVDFSKGVTLSRYGYQPNLRPTAKGTLVLGKQIGKVRIGGKDPSKGRVVPFFDKISVE